MGGLSLAAHDARRRYLLRQFVPLLNSNNGGSGLEIADTLAKAAKLEGVDSIITGHSTVMTPADLMEYPEFNRSFLEYVRAAKKAGRSVEDAASAYKFPERYAAYRAPTPGSVKNNIEVIDAELNGQPRIAILTTPNSQLPTPHSVPWELDVGLPHVSPYVVTQVSGAFELNRLWISVPMLVRVRPNHRASGQSNLRALSRHDWSRQFENSRPAAAVAQSKTEDRTRRPGHFIRWASEAPEEPQSDCGIQMTRIHPGEIVRAIRTSDREFQGPDHHSFDRTLRRRSDGPAHRVRHHSIRPLQR